MARKIFVSYKYGDSSVREIPRYGDNSPTTARHYVDQLQEFLDANDHINKGEEDGQDLSSLKDEAIESKLRDKIFDSSITIVLISKNMKDPSLSEDDQWIPWEISYSLKEISRNGRKSSTNAMLAVVIPDENGSYEYFVQPKGCPHCGGVEWKQNSLFKILGENMFNRKQVRTVSCSGGVCSPLHIGADHSYIYPIQWDKFKENINSYLNHAVALKENIEDYIIIKTV
jgi:hypothetical protein